MLLEAVLYVILGDAAALGGGDDGGERLREDDTRAAVRLPPNGAAGAGRLLREALESSS